MSKPKAVNKKDSQSWLFLPILMGLFQSTLIAATPKFITITGLSAVQWAVLLSMPTLLFLFMSPRWGRWADRHGAGVIIRYSALGLGLSILTLSLVWWLGKTLSFAPWLWFMAIAVSRLLYGVSASGVMPTCQSLAVETSSKREATDGKSDALSMKRLGFVGASLSIGRLCGPIVLIVLASQISWVLSVFCVVALPIVWAVVTFSLTFSLTTTPKKIGDTKRLEESKKEESGDNDNRSTSPQVRVFFALAFCVTLLLGYLQFILGPLFLEWLKDAEQATFMMGLTMTAVATTALLCQLLIVKRLNWRSPNVLIILSLVLIASTLGFSVAQSTHLVLAMMVPIAAVIALITPIYSRFAMALSNATKGQISGKLAVAHTSGYPLGSLLAGLSYGKLTFWWLPLSLTAITIFLLSCTIVYRSRVGAHSSLAIDS